jgi:AcrR family transcriptional regulator
VPEANVVALSPKIEQRKRRTRDLLLRESAALFVTRGFENVSVEDILAATGMARSSFYRFFSNREDVLANIVRPVFERGSIELTAIPAHQGERIVTGILKAYLQLWRRSPNALRLSTRVGGVHFSLFKDVHNEFRRRLEELVRLASRENILRNNNPDYSARLIARVAVPTLEVYSGDPNREQLFMSSMKGLLLTSETNS